MTILLLLSTIFLKVFFTSQGKEVFKWEIVVSSRFLVFDDISNDKLNIIFLLIPRVKSK